MKIGSVSGRVLGGSIGAVVLVAAIVIAATILSPVVEREQQVFTALEIVVLPAVFPVIISGVDPSTEQPVTVNVTNPFGNPGLTGVFLIVRATAIPDCALFAIMIEVTDLCASVYATTPVDLATGESFEVALLIIYNASFVGTATISFQAEGESA